MERGWHTQCYSIENWFLPLLVNGFLVRGGASCLLLLCAQILSGLSMWGSCVCCPGLWEFARASSPVGNILLLRSHSTSLVLQSFSPFIENSFSSYIIDSNYGFPSSIPLYISPKVCVFIDLHRFIPFLFKDRYHFHKGFFKSLFLGLHLCDNAQGLLW